ncbi:MAG: LamG-like jellyroll fold domain-containing protein [Nanoarchaeota archaeon]
MDNAITGSLYIGQNDDLMFNQSFANITFFSSVVLEDTNGFVNYTNGINFTDPVNVYNALSITNNLIVINSSIALDMNRSAVVTLYGLAFTDAHAEYALDDVNFANCTASTDPACTHTNYAGSNFTFTTSHFTSFRAGEGNISEAILCSELNLTNTLYTLSQDVTTDDYCFNITTSNITLDCANHRIIGNQEGYGISIKGIRGSNITIKNCFITNFTRAIHLYLVNDSLFDNNTLYANNGVYAGIYMQECYSNRITNSNFSNNNASENTGVHLRGGNNNIISNNHFEYNTISNPGSLGPGGIVGLFWNASNNTIANNQFYFNNVSVDTQIIGGGIIGLYPSSDSYWVTNNTISNNTLSSNTITTLLIWGGGILGLRSSDSNNITNNLLNLNYVNVNNSIIGGGILGLHDSQNNTVRDTIMISNRINSSANIDGGGILGFTSNSNNTILSNITINSNVVDAYLIIFGGGVLGMDSVDSCNMQNISITSNNITFNDTQGGAVLGLYYSRYNMISDIEESSNDIYSTANLGAGGALGMYQSNDNNVSNVLVSSNNITVTNNTYGGGAVGFNRAYSNNLFNFTIINNTLTLLSGGSTYGGVLGMLNGYTNTVLNFTILNNTIYTPGYLWGGIIGLAETSYANIFGNITIANNTVRTDGYLVGGSIGTYRDVDNNIFSDITLYRNNPSSTLVVFGGAISLWDLSILTTSSDNNTFRGITINDDSTTYPAISLSGTVSKNRFENCNINYSAGRAIDISDFTYISTGYPSNNTFINNTLVDASSGSLRIYSGTWNNNLIFNQTFINSSFPTSVVFENPNGSINYTSGVNFTDQANIYDVLNISNNSVTVNSSIVDGMNRSAVVKIKNLPFTDAHVEYALDDVTFVNCTSETDPACTDVTYIDNNLTFTTSHFTRFIAGEGNITDTIKPNINFTYPTPDNGTTITDTYFAINVSIGEPDLKDIVYNWNGTNYTIYDDSLVLMMNFDNRSSLDENNTYVVDFSVRGNNGTVSGSASSVLDGRYEGGFYFDGKLGYISCGKDLPGMSGASVSGTLEAWFKADEMDNQAIMVIGEHVDRHAFGLYLYQNGSISIAFNGGYSWVSYDSNLYSTGEWHYFVATLNSGAPKLYLDGKSIAGGGSSPSTIVLDDCFIGKFTGSSYFNGTIDEVRIWNRTLSAGEVYQQYVSNLNKFNSTQWYLYVNQSRNSTNGLLDGVYNYSVYASDSSDNENSTETRFVTVDAVLDCGELNSSGTTYTLSEDVTTDGSCFNITADNITLDCSGYSIIGKQNGYGFNISNRANVTVKNCFITNFTRAINLENVNNSLFDNNTIYANNGDYAGMYLSLGSNNSFNNINFTSNNASISAGIYILDSDFNLVNASSFYNNNITSNVNLAGGLLYLEGNKNNITNLNFTSNTVFVWGANIKGGIAVIDDVSENNTFKNLVFESNNITLYGTDMDSGGIFGLYRASNNNLTDVTFDKNYVFSNSTIIGGGILGFYQSGVDNNHIAQIIIQNNKVEMTDASGYIGGGSIGLFSASYNEFNDITITNNTIIGPVIGGGIGGGVNSFNNIFSDIVINQNNITDVHPFGGGEAIGILGIDAGSQTCTNNTFSNIEIANYTSTSGGAAIGIILSSDQNIFEHVRINYTGGFGIYVKSFNAPVYGLSYAENNSFSNITFTNTPDGAFYLWTDQNNNLIFNQTFIDQNITSSVVLENPNGSINYTSGFNITGQVNLYDVLNISNNSITVNSSLATEMNRSAVVKIKNLPFTGAHPEVASDDTTFVNCTDTTDPTCNLITYINNNLTFTTSHFTRFIAGEGNMTDTIKPNINFNLPTTVAGTYDHTFITVNVTATDDVAIDTINITLWNTDGIVNSSNSSTSPFYWNITGLAYGTYYLNVTVNDTSNNVNSTETRIILLQSAAVAISCGDGTCNGAENCESCPGDCGCGAGYICSAGICQVVGSSPPPSITPPPVTPPPVTPPPSFLSGVSVAAATSTRNAGSPCYNIRYTERNKTLDITNSQVSQEIIPLGYELAAEPVVIDCLGEDLDISFNVPDNFIDLRAMKCSQGRCLDISFTEIDALKCGEKIFERRRQSVYLPPEAMPIKIAEKSVEITDNDDILRSGNNSVQFLGNSIKGLEVTLSMPNESIKEAENTRFKIVGTPLVIELNEKVVSDMIISLPYVEEEYVLPETLNVYVKVDDGWEYIGGELDKDNKIITATVYDISQYQSNDNKIIFALMGVICTNCYGSTLEKVYEPEKPTRDAILFIHGFASSPVTYQPMIDDIRLTQKPYSAYTFGYPMTGTVDQKAEELVVKLESISDEFDRLFIVSHSLGGLITQKAIYNAYQENRSYLGKIKKAILVSVPNEGSPVMSMYKKLFGRFINEDSPLALFSVSTQLVDYIEKGELIPRVPGVDYRVISGIRNFEFDMLFTKLDISDLFGGYNLSDGVLSLKSAQHIGDGFINDKCSDYWEINNTHLDILDDFTTRKVIEQIVSEKIFGYNKYYDMHIDDCSPDDVYILVGKKIDQDKVFDATFCLCGNGVCGEGENAINCPSDCAQALAPGRNYLLLVALILMILVSLLIILLMYRLYKRVNHIADKKLKKKKKIRRK